MSQQKLLNMTDRQTDRTKSHSSALSANGSIKQDNSMPEATRFRSWTITLVHLLCNPLFFADVSLIAQVCFLTLIHPLQIQVRVVQRCIKRAWTLIWTSCSVIFLPMPELFVAKQWMTCKEYFHWPLAAGKWGISGNGMEWTHLIYRYYIYRKLFHSPSRGVSHHRSRNVKLEHQWVANHPGLANAWPFTLSFRKTKPKWIDCPCTRKKCVCVKERWRSPTLNHIESLFNLFTLLHCLK